MPAALSKKKKFRLTFEREYHECGDPVDEDDDEGWNMLVVIGWHGKTFAGSGEFILKGNTLIPNDINVNPEFRRMGLATKMYVAAETETGNRVHRHNIQTADGRAFWAQENRPFGR